MILELLLVGASLMGVAAAADPSADTTASPAGESAEEDPLSPYRTPFGVLVERSIGTTSRPVEFSWRRTKVQVAGTGDFLLELNNFNSAASGALFRFPSNGLIYELGLGYVWVWDTYSSQLLALTPYRQPGRPERLELEFAVGYPIAEGVVTVHSRFVPTVQMVLNAYAAINYNIYPFTFEGLKAREVASALLSPALSEEEIDNMEERRLDAMQVDPGRYALMLGLGNDLYLKQGVFLSPRVMFAVPLLAPTSGSELYVWGDMSMAIGVAF